MSKEMRELINKVKNFKEFLNENRTNDLIGVIPNKYVYHTSNPIFRDKIRKEDLIVKGKGETWLSDTNIDLEYKRIITFENIPPNSIKLIYKGSGSDTL